MTNDLDRHVAAIAQRQHGWFTRAQAMAAGATRKQIEHRLTAGRWIGDGCGLYHLAGSPMTWHGRLLGDCMASGGLASHRSGGVLWGLDGFRPGPPEITIPRGQRYRRHGLRVHESTQFDDRLGRTLRSGIPVTGVPRLIVDLGAVLPRSRVLLAIDEARRRRLTTWPELFEAMVRHSVQGRNGVGTLRSLLAEKYGEPVVPDSAFERMVERLLLDAGLPPPQLQHEVWDGDAFVARIDLAYPWRKVAIELDGRHHITDAAFERDPVRRNRLTALGWTVLTFTWRFYVDHPDRLVAEVAAVLATSGPLQGG